MSPLDWFILLSVLSGIIFYGMYKGRVSHSLEGYFLSNRDMPWYIVLLSIMGTQASAITYLTGPGQSYSDGMRFVQYYFGLPLAMIVISVFFVPVFSRLKVVTAYEFLEQRFDLKTRSLTAALFLLSRALSTGISICAPSLVLSSILGWNIYYTNVIMGGLLLIYTLAGGARAVAYTQSLQMLIILLTLLIVGYLSVIWLPGNMGLYGSLKYAGELGKMNIITSGIKEGHFDWKDKYNIWSGLIGGFFLALSYFGTDHSQVGRYLTARNEGESRKGLLMNGIFKVPMQFFILLLGILIFSFYQQRAAPVYFNETVRQKAMLTSYREKLLETEAKYDECINQGKREEAFEFRSRYRALVKEALPGEDVNDNNYIFLHFIRTVFPEGLIGLVLAIIFLSAWGSISAALNALAACTVVDFHKRFLDKKKSGEHDFAVSRWYTLAWGVFCIFVAIFAVDIGNSLIEAVNILGSLFYGVILGIFLVAFWIRKVGGHAVFAAAVVAEIAVILIYRADVISFLWLNAIGALLVMLLGLVFQQLLFSRK